MSPVLESTAIAAAAGMLLAKPAIETTAYTLGAGILFLGAANLDKIAEIVQKISDGIMQLPGLRDGINQLPGMRDALGETFGKGMTCEEANCGNTFRTSRMAEHLQYHIDILEKRKVLNALKAEEAETILKNESNVIERDERQIQLEGEEKDRARNIKQRGPRSNHKKGAR